MRHNTCKDLTGYVDSETEYLSATKGWTSIHEYSGEAIATYHKKALLFDVPSDYIAQPVNEWYVCSHNRGLDIKGSADLDIYYLTSRKHIKGITLRDMYYVHLSTLNGFRGVLLNTFDTASDKELPISDSVLRIYVAIQADGKKLKQPDKYRISVKKQRKKDRIERLLHESGITYSKHDGNKDTTMWGYSTYEFYLEGAYKQFPVQWYSLSHRQLAIIAEEANYWDGCPHNQRNVLRYASIIKSNSDFIQFANIVATGYRTSLHEIGTKNSNICYTVVGTHNKGASARKQSHGVSRTDIIQCYPTETNENGYNFKTISGMWLMRRNNNILVVGGQKDE